MRNIPLSHCLALLLFSTIASAQVSFVDPQSFGGSQAFQRTVAVSTGGAGKDIVGVGRDGLKYFTSRKGGQQLDRFIDDSRRAFPNRLLPNAASLTVVGKGYIAAGDVNGDGFDDLLFQSAAVVTPQLQTWLQLAIFDPITNSYPQAVVLDTFFSSSSSPHPGLSEAAFADLNNDGLVDVLESRFTSSTSIELVAILQRPAGVFGTPNVFAVFNPPPPGIPFVGDLGLAVGDLDGDLDQDVAVSVVSGTNSSSVMEMYTLTQMPGGTFIKTLVQTISGDRAPDVLITDLNNDTLNDMAFLDRRASSAQVTGLLNQTSGWLLQTLTPPLPLTFGQEERLRLIAFDWQTDGRDDLLVTGVTNSPLKFFTQSVSGGFVDETGQYVGSIAPSRLQGLGGALVSDLNADGHFDILINSNTNPGLLMGSSTGLKDATFSHGIEYRGQWSNSISNTGGRCVGDFNGDQFLDLVTVESGTRLVLHLGDGTGNFLQSYVIYSYISGSLGDQCASLDADLDGDLDIFVNGSLQNVILQNTGTAAFVPANIGGPAVSFNSIVEAQDVNGDNRSDIVVLGNSNSRPTSDFVLLNFVSGFVSVTLPKLPTDQLTSVEFGDFDGDLDIDLAVLSQPSGGVAPSSLLLFTNSGGSTPAFTRSQLLQNVSAIGAADLDNDSRQDLIATRSTAGGGITATILYNGGAGGFSVSNVAVQATGVSQDIATGDFNRDGFSDFVLSVQPSINFDSGRLSLMTNNQSGSFVESDSGVDINFAKRPIVADVDNDGDLDIFYSALSDQSSLRLILNQSIQLIASRRTSVVNPAPFILEIASAAPGTSVVLILSLDPLSSGTNTPLGLLRLTNPVTGPLLTVPSGGTLYYPIFLGSAPAFVGQTVSVQVAFFDSAGNIRLSNPQSVLLTN